MKYMMDPEMGPFIQKAMSKLKGMAQSDLSMWDCTSLKNTQILFDNNKKNQSQIIYTHGDIKIFILHFVIPANL